MDFSKSFIPLVNVNAHYQVQTNQSITPFRGSSTVKKSTEED
jgi:hypothetical protein